MLDIQELQPHSGKAAHKTLPSCAKACAVVKVHGPYRGNLDVHSKPRFSDFFLMDVKRNAALSGHGSNARCCFTRVFGQLLIYTRKEQSGRSRRSRIVHRNNLAETWNISMPALGTFGQLKLLQERLLKLVVHLAL